MTVDGRVAETVTAEQPLEFIFGTGHLIPKFEENVSGLKKGDRFAFTLDSGEAYGEIIPEAVVDLPIDLFMIDGQLDESLLTIGNVLPMTDNEGNRLMGVVKAVADDKVTMDFNHPMAGKTLNFEGEVTGVRDATAEDYLKDEMAGGCGCDDCGDEQGDCSSGCGCC